MKQPQIRQLTEEAVTIEFGDVISESLNRRIIACQRQILSAPFPGFIESVPAYCTLTIYYNPLKIASVFPYRQESIFSIVCGYLKPLLTQRDNWLSVAAEEIYIPVCYETPCAPDIEYAAKFCGLSVKELIELHCSINYTVFFIGFIPGFPYLGTNPEPMNVPRKAQPSLSVTAGSVGIAGKQSGIYPFTIPGGWQIIGQTPLILFDKHRESPCLLKAGMRVRFKPIGHSEYLKTLPK